LGALEQVLGDTFTPEVAEAWHDVYYLIAGLMKEAASHNTFETVANTATMMNTSNDNQAVPNS
jgi:hemoglobin-like flavoprotein